MLPATGRPDATQALRRARERFLVPERIDMSALAEDLAINRVTLYRWVGSRDQLLVEVVWTLAEEALAQSRASTTARGGERIVGVITRFLEIVIGSPGMQRWLSEEGEHAMRLLTRHETGFQPRLIRAVQALLEEEALELPVALDELAYIIVRLIESYTYLDLITGEQPDAGRAEPILRMLLRADHPNDEMTRDIPEA
jgi:hypothetical protein